MKTLTLHAATATLLAVVLAAPAAAGTVTVVSVIDGIQSGTGSPGFGCARIEVDTVANTASYRIAYTGLQGNETAAHFHGPAQPGVNAGVVQGLPAGNPKVGVWTYPEGLEDDILDGRIYINIHTTVAPGGEIRGQVADMVAAINGFQENPAVATGAGGFGVFDIDTCSNTLDYHIAFTGLSAAETAAHIHGMTLHTTNAGVVHGLPAGSPKVGTWNYPESMEQALLDGRAYVNIHSGNHPGGEIRGQITRIVAPLDNAQEPGGTQTPAGGCGLVAIDPGADDLSFFLRYDGLTGAATAAHIHGFAPPGMNAGVQFGIGTANPAKLLWDYPAASESDILAGLTYFNVHTAANPGGEIRGQIIFPNDPCTGDTDCNGQVNVQDLTALVLAWNSADPNADLNGDGVVDVQDLTLLILNWGPCP